MRNTYSSNIVKVLQDAMMLVLVHNLAAPMVIVMHTSGKGLNPNSPSSVGSPMSSASCKQT